MQCFCLALAAVFRRPPQATTRQSKQLPPHAHAPKSQPLQPKQQQTAHLPTNRHTPYYNTGTTFLRPTTQPNPPTGHAPNSPRQAHHTPNPNLNPHSIVYPHPIPSPAARINHPSPPHRFDPTHRSFRLTRPRAFHPQPLTTRTRITTNQPRHHHHHPSHHRLAMFPARNRLHRRASPQRLPQQQLEGKGHKVRPTTTARNATAAQTTDQRTRSLGDAEGVIPVFEFEVGLQVSFCGWFSWAGVSGGRGVQERLVRSLTKRRP